MTRILYTFLGSWTSLVPRIHSWGDYYYREKEAAHCKKGIVILTSELLFEFQMREHGEARAKCLHILEALPDQECGNTLAMH